MTIAGLRLALTIVTECGGNFNIVVSVDAENLFDKVDRTGDISFVERHECGHLVFAGNGGGEVDA